MEEDALGIINAAVLVVSVEIIVKLEIHNFITVKNRVGTVFVITTYVVSVMRDGLDDTVINEKSDVIVIVFDFNLKNY